ncbi:hypothetical protein GCM10011408_42320 [Dyella caseinilytica]|nr:hypothetical protein GCM10011408_42320 [Dyella caseinilytica]
MPNGIAFGSLAGVGLGASSSLLAGYAAAGSWSALATGTAQTGLLVTGDGLTAGASTYLNNEINGETDPFKDVGYSTFIGATAPLLSGEALVAAAGETGGSTVLFNSYTGVLSSLGIAADSNSAVNQHK